MLLVVEGNSDEEGWSLVRTMDRVVVVHVDTKDDQDKSKKGNDYAKDKKRKNKWKILWKWSSSLLMTVRRGAWSLCQAVYKA